MIDQRRDFVGRGGVIGRTRLLRECGLVVTLFRQALAPRLDSPSIRERGPAPALPGFLEAGVVTAGKPLAGAACGLGVEVFWA